MAAATPTTYAVEKRPNGAWGVKRSDSETIFGAFDTRAEAQACADGATWVQDKLGAGQ